MRKLLIVVLALSLVGCAASFKLFEGQSKDRDHHLQLALTALRATCSLHECEAFLTQVDLADEDARRACAMAWLTEAKACAGGNE